MSSSQDLEFAADIAQKLRARAQADVMGRDDVIELVLIALLSGGHVLLEDYPGSGKTTLAKAIGNSIIDDKPDDQIPSFRRLQFTPDLLPSDITGVMVLDTQKGDFSFRRGPIFAYVVLVDEINRATPKVQSALLEAMAEGQVTVDNISYPLDDLFFVIATQNPQDAIGTYPLPQAQLDRFMFKVKMHYIQREAELRVLDTWGTPRQQVDLPRVTRSDVVNARNIILKSVTVAPAIKEALVSLAWKIRSDDRVSLGVSTRALVHAIPALQTLAALQGMDYIIPDHLKHLALPLFQHRFTLRSSEFSPGDVIKDAVEQVMEELARASLK